MVDENESWWPEYVELIKENYPAWMVPHILTEKSPSNNEEEAIQTAYRDLLEGELDGLISLLKTPYRLPPIIRQTLVGIFEGADFPGYALEVKNLAGRKNVKSSLGAIALRKSRNLLIVDFIERKLIQERVGLKEAKSLACEKFSLKFSTIQKIWNARKRKDIFVATKSP